MSNRALWVLGSVLFGLAVPAQAQQGAPEDPTLKKTGDSVTEPFDGKEVPEKLLAIQDDPYSLAGLRKCAAIIREVRDLDALLGPALHQQVAKRHAKTTAETQGRSAGGDVGAGEVHKGGDGGVEE